MELVFTRETSQYKYEVYLLKDFDIHEYTKDSETKKRVLKQIECGELSPYKIVEYEKCSSFDLWHRYNSCPLILQTDEKHALKEYLICVGGYE